MEMEQPHGDGRVLHGWDGQLCVVDSEKLLHVESTVYMKIENNYHSNHKL